MNKVNKAYNIYSNIYKYIYITYCINIMYVRCNIVLFKKNV